MNNNTNILLNNDELIDTFSKFVDEVKRIIELTYNKAKEIVSQIYEIYWEAYRNEGMPYGEEPDDLIRWINDINERETLRLKHEEEMEWLETKQIFRERLRNR